MEDTNLRFALKKTVGIKDDIHGALNGGVAYMGCVDGCLTYYTYSGKYYSRMVDDLSILRPFLKAIYNRKRRCVGVTVKSLDIRCAGDVRSLYGDFYLVKVCEQDLINLIAWVCGRVDNPIENRHMYGMRRCLKNTTSVYVTDDFINLLQDACDEWYVEIRHAEERKSKNKSN